MRSQDALEAFVTSGSIMLIAALIIWLTLIILALAFCRAAASSDGRHRALTAHYPSRSTTPPHPLDSLPGTHHLAAGLILNKAQPAPAPRPRRHSRAAKHALRI
jgi:hypothetical protein